jgi:hypothetical protein
MRSPRCIPEHAAARVVEAKDAEVADLRARLLQTAELREAAVG